MIERVFVAEHRIDFRKGFNGLLGECYRLGLNPYAGICVVFVKSDKTQIRVIVGDDEGLFLLSRRFDKGSIKLSWLNSPSPSKHSITQGELSLLLEGANFEVKKRVKKWRTKELHSTS
jgi:transposase